jgi:hypothetical protein
MRSQRLTARAAAAAAAAAAAPGSSSDEQQQVAVSRYRAEAAALCKQLGVQRALPGYVGSVEVLLMGAEGLSRAKPAG